MTDRQITDYRTRIATALSQGKLHLVFKDLHNICQGLGNYQLSQDVNDLEESYKYMIRYASTGVKDPSRKKVYDDIVNEAYKIMDRIVRAHNLKETNTIYYNTSRTIEASQGERLKYLMPRYLQLEPSMYDSTVVVRSDAEGLERRIFDYLWTTFPLSSDDANIVSDTLDNPEVNWHFKAMMTSALTLSLIEFFDLKKVMLLIKAYQEPTPQVSVRAVIGLAMVLYRYRNRPLSQKIKDAIAAIADTSETWRSDLSTTYMAMIRTRDTERITKKLNDEIVPEMMKLRDQIMRRSDIMEADSLEMNPEWQESLENSGVGDKIKELSELQSQGSDIMIGTFAHMKGFPFFSSVANWFVPFNPKRTEAVSNPMANANQGGGMSIMEVVDRLPILCDSDKYSMLLALSSMPEMQKKMMIEGLQHQTEAAQEATEDFEHLDATDKNKRKYYIQMHMHELYRFFRLFRRKNEFRDPFKNPMDLSLVEVFADELNTNETQRLIAELYLQCENYKLAQEAFRRLVDMGELSEELMQKIGYCYQKLGQYKEALEYYEQAELFNAESNWTLKRIAYCHRMLSNYKKALEYYKRIEQIAPDNISNTLATAGVLMVMEDYPQAIQSYYKIEFLRPENKRYIRPLAWALFQSQQYDKAKDYYDMVLLDNPKYQDYLNMGHLAMIMGDYTEAMNYYKTSALRMATDRANEPTQKETTLPQSQNPQAQSSAVTTPLSDYDQFCQLFHQDAQMLQKHGFDTSLIPLILDAIAYEL